MIVGLLCLYLRSSLARKAYDMEQCDIVITNLKVLSSRVVQQYCTVCWAWGKLGSSHCTCRPGHEQFGALAGFFHFYWLLTDQKCDLFMISLKSSSNALLLIANMMCVVLVSSLFILISKYTRLKHLIACLQTKKIESQGKVLYRARTKHKGFTKKV